MLQKWFSAHTFNKISIKFVNNILMKAFIAQCFIRNEADTFVDYFLLQKIYKWCYINVFLQRGHFGRKQKGSNSVKSIMQRWDDLMNFVH